MEPYDLELLDIVRRPELPGAELVLLKTNRGNISTRLHAVSRMNAGVVWVGGAGGGVHGPAGGMYTRLAGDLAEEGIASLRVDYRQPNDLVACALDTLMGAAYLKSLGCTRLILVGHSFGGAVVITAGVEDPAVVGVATLASQNASTEMAASLSPRALLVLHGTDDAVLPDGCSRDIYFRARHPKQIELYPGCTHNFDECREEVEHDLKTWIRGIFLATLGS